MATAAVVGLSAGKRLLSSSFYYSDLTDKLSYINSDHHGQVNSTRNVVAAKKSLSNYSPSYPSSNRNTQSIKAVKERVDIDYVASTTEEPWFQSSADVEEEEEEDSSELNSSVEALLLLQKSMLEKQWSLSFERTVLTDPPVVKKTDNDIPVTCSGLSARRRRLTSKKKLAAQNKSMMSRDVGARQLKSMISPDLIQNRLKGYVKGVVSEELLTHAEVVRLSNKIKKGLSLEEQRFR